MSRDDLRESSATTWECTECGERVTVPPDARVVPVLVTDSAAQPQRVVTVGGEVIHRCTLGDE